MPKAAFELANTDDGVSLEALLTFATHARRGLVIWDRDLRIVGYNHLCCQYISMDPSEMQLGWTYETLLQKIEEIARRTEDGMVWEARLPLTDFESVKRYLEEVPNTVARLPGRNDDGVLVTRAVLDDKFMLSILSDMRELEREQQETKLEKIYLKTILENMTDGAMMIDPDHMVTVCNKRLLELLQIDREAVKLPMEIESFVRLHGDLGDLPDDIRDIYVEERASVARGERDESGSYRVARHLRNGKIMEVVRVALPNGGGVLTVSDATERAELTRQRKLFKTVIDHIDEGVTLIRRNGEVEVVNDRMREIYDLAGCEARIGDHVEDFVRAASDLQRLSDAERKKEVSSRVAAAISQEPGTKFSTRELYDGRAIAIARTLLEDGRSVATHRDVTNEFQAQRLLEEAKQAAEDANRMKSDFLAKVTHDLRTPMHGVLGMAAILERSDLTASQSHTLEMLVKSGRLMVDLIDGLLTVSTIETGEMTLEPQQTNLDELLTHCVEIVRPQAAKKGLDIQLSTGFAGGVDVLADPTRLKQIILNLLGNAVKFTDEGYVELTAYTRKVDYSVELTANVQDTGPGIPSDKFREIFQRFSQLEEAGDKKRDGVGLGLSIARSLAEMMGGHISVESAPGQGASFSFVVSLPVDLGGELPGEIRSRSA